MNYQESLAFIHGAKKNGPKPHLDRITALMHDLGDPQDQLHFIHLAGTNGKGSTAVSLSTIITQAGYKTGLYTSPFIYDFNERIQINNQNIANKDLAKVITQIKAVIDCPQSLVHQTGITELEIIMAAAFLYFYQQHCQVVILEVGLGGRFDATNIIKTPWLSIITSLSLDHTNLLGKTIDKIAFEKAGIIKENGHTLVYPFQAQEALAVLKENATKRHNQLTLVETSSLKIDFTTWNSSQFTYEGETYQLSLLGEYQIYNALVVIAAIKFLTQNHYLQISPSQLKKSLTQVYWPGRLEILGQKPLFIVDGSHNPDGMRSFVTALSKLTTAKQRRIIIFSMLATKDIKSSLQLLSQIADMIIFTQINFPRAATAAQLYSLAQELHLTQPLYQCPENHAAVAQALALAQTTDLICAVGSLYMIGDIRNSYYQLTQFP